MRGRVSRPSVAQWGAILILVLASSGLAQAAPTVTVNCDAGQSLNGTLSNLNRRLASTVIVQGTCTEYVSIYGFDGLTLKGQAGATLQQPSTDPTNGLAIHVLLISASRSVTVDGFAVHSRSSATGGIGIQRHSGDVQLRNLTIDGAGGEGIVVREGSQVSIAGVTVTDPGYAAVGVYDPSDAHIENCLFQNSTGTPWRVGIDVFTGRVTLQNTTIRNMQVGINIYGHGTVSLQNFNTYFPLSNPNDVIIDNPAGTNFEGVQIANGSHMFVGGIKLRILNAGQPFGANSAGVWVSDGSTLIAYDGTLVVSNSKGQGVFISNSSQATLVGSSITGSNHGGLVVTNWSTVAIEPGSAPTQVSGNGVDLYCTDGSRNLITGVANIGGATTTVLPLGCAYPNDYIGPLP